MTIDLVTTLVLETVVVHPVDGSSPAALIAPSRCTMLQVRGSAGRHAPPREAAETGRTAPPLASKGMRGRRQISILSTVNAAMVSNAHSQAGCAPQHLVSLDTKVHLQTRCNLICSFAHVLSRLLLRICKQMDHAGPHLVCALPALLLLPCCHLRKMHIRIIAAACAPNASGPWAPTHQPLVTSVSPLGWQALAVARQLKLLPEARFSQCDSLSQCMPSAQHCPLLRVPH